MMKLPQSLLLLAVAAGTGCYVRGLAPPFPWNAAVFDLTLLLAVVYAFSFGR